MNDEARFAGLFFVFLFALFFVGCIVYCVR